MAIDYATPGPFTAFDGIDGIDVSLLGTPDGDPVAICRPVQALVIQPTDTEALGLAAARLAEKDIRPVSELVRRLLDLDPAPLAVPRAPENRVVGTCRHYAVISCALLRRAGIAARVRCGFATYFQAGQALDHWITEYRLADPEGSGSQCWVRIDSEVLDGSVIPRPHDLAPEDFLSGGEAWGAYRRGEVDPATFGVFGTANWGAAEIRGNAVKDLAALNKVEVLPWDEWGRMTDAYAGHTGADYDDLLDTLARVCADDEPAAVAALYAHEDLTVPPALLS
jgi:hypothetical protein